MDFGAHDGYTPLVGAVHVKEKQNTQTPLIYLLISFSFRASGTVYTAIDVATGQEVSFSLSRQTLSSFVLLLHLLIRFFLSK